MRVLVVADRGKGRVEELEHRAIGTRLGEGLADGGLLRDEAMRRTLEATVALCARARSHGASLVCIATSAMRRAENADAFARRLQAATGEPLRVINGKEEAAASFRGAVYEDAFARDRVLGRPHRVAVLDIGGGSTECALGCDGVLESALSVEIGAVRLTERFPQLNGGTPGAPAREAALHARAFVEQATASWAAFPEITELRAVAGTPATIAAIAEARDVEHVRGVRLRRELVASILERLLDASLEERRAMPGMLPQRADVLAAGAVLLSAATDALRCSEAIVETNDLLLGYLLGQASMNEAEFA